MSYRFRPATLDDVPTIAAIQTAGWRENFRGMIPDRMLDGPLHHDHMALWRRVLPELIRPPALLAFDLHGEPAGFIAAGPPRGSDLPYDGEIYAIYVVKAHQRCGLGLRMMLAMTDRLKQQHCRTMMLWTLEGNARARAFYESLGGRPVAREFHPFDTATLPEIAYGWHHISQLEQACRSHLIHR